jgi:hypothetical protein
VAVAYAADRLLLALIRRLLRWHEGQLDEETAG